LHEDDIVIAMDRPFVGSGFKVAKLSAKDLPALLLQRVGRFQIDDSESSDFVWAFVHSRSFQLQLLAQQEGTDLPHISRTQIENTLIQKAALQNTQAIGAFVKLADTTSSLDHRIERCVDVKRRLLKELLS
jgi:type I restriction enzyme S subunit